MIRKRQLKFQTLERASMLRRLGKKCAQDARMSVGNEECL